MPVYVGQDGVYTGSDGVFSGIGELAYIDNYDRAGPITDRYTSLHSITGSLTESAAFAGPRGYRQHSDEEDPNSRVVEVWSEPGDGLDNYPRPGDEIAFAIRLLDIGSSHQSWFLIGGSGGRYPRYQIDIIGSDVFRVVVRESDGNRFDVATPDESNETRPTWSNLEGDWLTVVVKWFDIDSDSDTRTGIAAWLFDALEFPWGSTEVINKNESFVDEYESGGFSGLDHITMCDSADHPNNDGSEGAIPHEPGRWGARANTQTWQDIDEVALVHRPD